MSIMKFLLEKQDKKVVICGDGMIDEYYEVQSERISPEFPIPVMMSESFEPVKSISGGACNVANQFRYFKHLCDPVYVGFADNALRDQLDADNINHNLVQSDYKIPKKKRIYKGDFPLCRWDIEDKNPKLYSHEDIRKLTNKIAYYNPDIVVFSDYNKGTFDKSCYINWAEMFSNSFVIVDPKINIDQWYACDIFKPNYQEAIKLSGGITDWKKQCEYFKNELKCKNIIITYGAEGVKGVVDKELFEYRPSEFVSAESVIGAGDCFMAFLAMSKAAGLDVEESVEVAFQAGKIYVQRKHNKPLTPLDLLDSIKEKRVENVEFFRNRDYKLVFTNGVFDVFHAGHLEMLQWAKKQGDKLVVALNTDDSVKKLEKGPDRPVNSLEDRLKVIKGLECVDYVCTFSDETPKELLKNIFPDLIVKGGDYKRNEVVGHSFCEVKLFPLYKDLSSSKMIKYGNI